MVLPPKMQVATTKTTVTTYELDEEGLEEILCQWFSEHLNTKITPSNIRWGYNEVRIDCSIVITEVENG